jgi:hypothetical protein
MFPPADKPSSSVQESQRIEKIQLAKTWTVQNQRVRRKCSVKVTIRKKTRVSSHAAGRP